MTLVYKIESKKKRNLFSNISINSWLIIVNVISFLAFFVLLILKPEWINYVALNPSNIINNFYYWTFVTSMFMHGGFFHLFVNMLSLFFVGGLIEKILGAKRYFWFYLASGLFAGLFFVLMSFVFPSDFNAYAVGASGALFGVVGLLVVLTPNLPVYIMFIPVPIKMKYAAPGMLVVLWLISITTNLGIGNTAHLGGLIFGLLFGFYLRKKYKKKTAYISKHFS